LNEAWSLIRNKTTIVLFETTAMQLSSQWLLRVQGDADHPGLKDGGQENNNLKKWSAEEESHKGSLTPPPKKLNGTLF
jgi:hypothetical protein